MFPTRHHWDFPPGLSGFALRLNSRESQAIELTVIKRPTVAYPTGPAIAKENFQKQAPNARSGRFVYQWV
jgi:hypothetical protein